MNQSPTYSKNRILRMLAFIMTLAGVALSCVGTADQTPLVFSPKELPEANAGQPYEVIVEVSGNDTPVYAFSVIEGNLPEGLILEYDTKSDDDAATLSGTPSVPGEYAFTLKAACRATSHSGETGEQKYILVVKP